MSKPIIYGTKVCFGWQSSFFTDPIINLPPDAAQVERHIAQNDFARARITLADGTVTEYVLGPAATGLQLLFPKIRVYPCASVVENPS